MSAQSLLEVAPKDLRFRADSKKQPPTVLYLTNSSSERVAFKVKTTAPKRYCVKPSADVVEANATMEVKVFMQNSKDLAPAVAGDCRDKFLIQSTPVPGDWTMKADGSGSTDVFNKKDNTRLVEEKLKVTLESPPAPPSPVPEASETAEFSAASPTAGAGRSLGAGGGGPQNSTVTRAGGGAYGGGGGADDLQAENRQLREKLAVASLRNEEGAAAAGGKGAFRIIHLLPVAILAFLLGYFL